MNIKKIAFWGGVAVVALTHVYMLVASLPESQMMAHAIINLVAAGAIVYAKA
jgi:hypothetical protein